MSEVKEMSRSQQTWIIVLALCVIGAITIFALAPEKDISHLSDYEKCDYSQFYERNGGSTQECQLQMAGEAADRLMRGGF